MPFGEREVWMCCIAGCGVIHPTNENVAVWCRSLDEDNSGLTDGPSFAVYITERLNSCRNVHSFQCPSSSHTRCFHLSSGRHRFTSRHPVSIPPHVRPPPRQRNQGLSQEARRAGRSRPTHNQETSNELNASLNTADKACSSPSCGGERPAVGVTDHGTSSRAPKWQDYLAPPPPSR